MDNFPVEIENLIYTFCYDIKYDKVMKELKKSFKYISNNTTSIRKIDENNKIMYTLIYNTLGIRYKINGVDMWYSFFDIKNNKLNKYSMKNVKI
jgi:hypothetical protein